MSDLVQEWIEKADGDYHQRFARVIGRVMR